MNHPRKAFEVAKTVLEVAELAWSAVENFHNHDGHHDQETANCCLSTEEIEFLRSENKRLRELLEQNLNLLQNLSELSCVVNDCPPDLHDSLAAALDSKEFLCRLQSLRASVNGTGIDFPFKEPTGADLDSAEILVNIDQEEPSLWVWITEEMVPGTSEEWSGIDDDNYVIVCEDHVVEGVANFIARCILTNPKAQKLAPEELQKTVAKSLGDMNKFEKMLNIWHAGNMVYTLSTWGLALAGLYNSRSMLKLAAKGVHASSKIVLKTF